MQIIYSLSSGGAEKFVVDLSNQLAFNGHDVVICMLLSDENDNLIFNRRFLNKSVKFHSMRFSSGFSCRKCILLEKYLEDEHPDIIHCHLNVIPYLYLFSLCKCKSVIVHTLHNVATFAGGSGLQYYLNRFYYKNNLIYPVCISKSCQKSYEVCYKLHNAPSIDNGRALVLKSSCYEEIKSEVFSYKKTSDTLIFVHIARCHSQKNQDLLIRAFNRLVEQHIDASLLIIGSGFDGFEGGKLRQLACNRIYFLGEKKNVSDYLLCSDAFCLSSKYEGLPISLLEALSCGVTPICTPVGGILDVITDGVTGYLSSDLSVDAYLDALKRFIAKPLPAQNLMNYFETNYSIEVCAAKYEKFYGELIRREL